MDNTKKTSWILRIILFLILFIPTYFAIYNIYLISSDNFTVENTTKIEIADKDNHVMAEYTGNDVKIWIKTLDNATKVNDASRDLAYEQPLILKFYKGDKQFVYGMYLSLNPNDCLIMNSDQDLLLMKEQDAKRILDTTLADMIYDNNTIPVAVLYEGENAVKIYPSGGEWMLKKSDGFYPSTVPSTISPSNKAIDHQNRPFDIKFNIEPDMLSVDVISDKELIYSDIYSNFVENFVLDEMKDLQYTLNAEWYEDELNDYYGKATYVLDVKYYVTAKFDISQTEAEPGDIVAIMAYNMSEDEVLTLTTDIGYETKFVSIGTNKIALIPIGADFTGKTFNLTLTSDVNDPIDYYLKINEKETQSKNIGAGDETVSKNLSESAKTEKQAKYNEIFTVSTGNDEKYWTDKFIMPKEGPVLLEYGWKVTVNMGNAYINNGINIDLAKGDSIIASNTGKVIFAGEIPDDGKLIVIDHGMGIKTWYGHLDEINVKVGDGVIKGQQIGTGGMTGLFTTFNNNLYFAVSVKNIFVNPVALIANGVPGIDSVVNSGTSINPELDSDDSISIEDMDDTDMPEAAEETEPEESGEDSE
ncbi:MAG: M23 family metallopeptidase [Oscillospiraceae bacterium]|nr:M23 family metallopeptidase [Oscillospiraceae bacterium]